MKRPFGCLRAIGRALLILVVAVAVVHSLATLILGRRVEAKLAAIRGKGEPVSLAELAPPPIPDAGNAAVLYAKVFQQLDTPEGKRDDTTLADYADLRRRARDPALWPKARQAAARWQEAFALAEEAAAQPHCRFPVRWEDGFEAQLPHLAQLRRLCRMIATSATVAAREGRAEDAGRLCLLAFRVAEAPREEPSVISQLVRYAGIQASTSALREVVTWTTLPPAQARETDQVLRGIDLRPGYLRALKAERANGVAVYQSLPVRVAEWAARLLGVHEGPFWLLPRGIATGYAWRPVLYADESIYLARWDGALQAARTPWRLHRGSEWSLTAPTSFPRYALVARMLFPALVGVCCRCDTAIASLAGSRALLGLLAYKERFGEYPASLAHVQEKLAREVPPDPFSGKEFRYRRVGKGALLYSIGSDLKDDGGRPVQWLMQRVRVPPALVALAPAPLATRPRDPYDGDIPWWLAP